MGIAAKLFYSSDTEKQTLHRRIVPSDEQQQIQQERWNDLVEYLQSDLEERTGYAITSWLQGSYKFATQIRPSKKGQEFDIDLGIYFNWSGKPEDGNFAPAKLKALTQESLNEYKNETGDEVLEIVTPAKNRCSRIRFSGDFHIDVPTYHIDPEKDARSLATEENIWENSDPKALYKWFQGFSCKEDGDQLRRIIRYLKMWAALHFGEKDRPSTIMLTVLTVVAFDTLSTDQKDGDDTSFRYVVEKIIINLNGSKFIANPVDHSENLNRMSDSAFLSFVSKFNELLSVSVEALKVNNEFESAIIWQTAFQYFFPLPVVEQDEKTDSTLLPVVQFVPEILIKAFSSNNTRFVYEGQNQIKIPRNCNIQFSIINKALLPQGARIEWMVRNQEQEAEIENDMGHMAGTALVGQEHSAYKGVHFMDLTIKSNFGSVIGFRRIPVEVTGMVMPPRNPRKKPGYLRLLRKRR